MNSPSIETKRSSPARRPRRPARPAALVEPLERRELMASAAGTLDATFGAGRGFVESQIPPTSTARNGSNSDIVTGVFARPNGKVLVAAVYNEGFSTVQAFSGYTSYFVLQQFNANGTPDATFGQGGQESVPIPFQTLTLYLTQGGSLGQAVVMQPDGKLLVAGTMKTGNSMVPPGSTFAVLRLNVDGSVDSTYGANGLAAYAAGAQTAATPGLTGVSAAALQPDGKLVLGGLSFASSIGPSGRGSATAVRLNPDGSLDTSFGTGGTTTIDDATFDGVDRIAIQPDGGVLLAGPVQTDVPGGFLYRPGVLRLDAAGKLDTAFGGPSASGGVAVVPASPGVASISQYLAVTGLAVQPDGKIVLSNDALDPSGIVPGTGPYGLSRLDADGTPDATFGRGGTVAPAVAGPIGIQADGKIVVGGSLAASGSMTSTLAAAERFNADGSPDSGFGNTAIPGLGQFEFGPATARANATALAIQPDGNILLAGATTATPTGVRYPPAQFGVARVLSQATSGAPARASATPPASFDGSGRTDLAAYLPAFGAFAYRPTSGAADVITPFGLPGAGQTLPAAADYAGTGTTQLAAYLPSYGVYAVRPPSGPDQLIPFGIAGPGQSIPAPADYDGDGKADLAVYLPAFGAFGIRPSGGGLDQIVPFGIAGPGQTIAAPGDFDGDGKADIAAYLPAFGAFAIRPSGGGADQIIPFGLPGAGQSIPIPGDYDGSGKAELAVYLPALGLFAYRPADGGPDVIVPFGVAGDGTIPVPGDYSGSGHAEIAVYDPNYGAFAYRPGGGAPDVIAAFGIPGPGQSIPLAVAPPSAIASVAVPTRQSASAAALATARSTAVPGGPMAGLEARRTARATVPQAKPESATSST